MSGDAQGFYTSESSDTDTGVTSESSYSRPGDQRDDSSSKTFEHHITIPTVPAPSGSYASSSETSGFGQPPPKDMDLLKSILHNASDSSSHSEKGDGNKSDGRPSSGGSSNTQDVENGNTDAHRPDPPRPRKRATRVTSARRARRTVSAVSRRAQSPPPRAQGSRRHSDPDVRGLGANKSEKEMKNESRRRQRRATRPGRKVQPAHLQAKYSRTLEEKYTELRDLMYGEYRARPRGSPRDVRPPPGPPPRNARRKPAHDGQLLLAGGGEHGAMSQGVLGSPGWEFGTIADMKEGEIGVVIDSGTTKHVQFANGKERDGNGNAERNGEKSSERSRKRTKGTRNRPTSAKEKPKSVGQRPKSAKEHKDKTNDSRFESHKEGHSTVFKMAAPGAPSRSRSSSSSSRGSTRSPSSEKESRSRSPTFHQLKTTENQRTLDWLKAKNKMHRKQKAADRKKQREERKQKQKEVEEQEARRPKIDQALDEWMKNKRKEARLLKRRGRMQKAGSDPNLKFGGTVSVTETTTDLKDGEVVEEVVEEGGEVPAENANPEQETQRLKEDEGKQRKAGVRAERVKSAKRRPPSPKKSTGKPKQSTTGDNKSSEASSQSTGKSRLSYNEWVKQKQGKALADAKKKKKEADELASSDPELDQVVTDMAQKRIDQIKNKQKRIDTGVDSIDDEANKSLDERVAEKDHVTDDSEPITDAKQIPAHMWRKPHGAKAAKRPASARPATAKSPAARAGRPRPSSAKPGLSVPDPKRSGASPVPAKSAADDRPSSRASSRPYSPNRRPRSPDKPSVVSTAYRKVKYQQASWDDFSEHVWEKLNEDEAGERPEPQGSDSPEVRHTQDPGTRSPRAQPAPEKELEKEQEKEQQRDAGADTRNDAEQAAAPEAESSGDVQYEGNTEEVNGDDNAEQATDTSDNILGSGDDGASPNEQAEADEEGMNCANEPEADGSEPAAEQASVAAPPEIVIDAAPSQPDTAEVVADDTGEPAADTVQGDAADAVDSPAQEDVSPGDDPAASVMVIQENADDNADKPDQETASPSPPPNIEVVFDESSQNENVPPSILKEESAADAADQDTDDKRSKHVTFVTAGDTENEAPAAGACAEADAGNQQLDGENEADDNQPTFLTSDPADDEEEVKSKLDNSADDF